MGFKLGETLRYRPALLERRDRCFTGKTAFATKRAAREARHGIHERTSMRPFRCPFCAQFHLGHRR
jgi:hypothetical protein